MTKLLKSVTRETAKIVQRRADPTMIPATQTEARIWKRETTHHRHCRHCGCIVIDPLNHFRGVCVEIRKLKQISLSRKTIKTKGKSMTMTECKMAFALPGNDNIIDVIRPDTGKSWHYSEGLEEIRLRYPGAEIVNCDEHFKAKAARQDTPIVWTETTREKYWEMLEVLPPAAMGNGGFLVGEPWDHHATTGQPRFAGFREWQGRFFEASRPMTRKEYAVEILNSAKLANTVNA